MGRITGARQDLGWWVIVYAFAVTPIDFGTLGLTASDGPDLIRWSLLLPVWFLPIVVLGPRWPGLIEASRRPPVSWFLVWAAMGALSFLWAVAPRQALLAGLAIASHALLATWYVHTAGWRNFAAAAATGLTVIAGAGVVYDLANGTLVDGVIDGRSSGLATSPTTQGRLGAFAVILGTAIAFWNRRVGLSSPMPLLGIAIGVVAMGFAETRTSIAAAAVAICYGSSRRLAPFHRWLAGLGVVVLVPALVLMSSAFIDVTPFGERGDPTSVSGRTRIWPLVLDLIAERPLLGYGWGAEEQLLVQAALSGRISFLAGTSHSIVLSPLLSGGVVGFSLIAVAFASAIRLRRRADPWITAIILSILIGGLTEAIVHRPSVSVILLAGCFAALSMADRPMAIESASGRGRSTSAVRASTPSGVPETERRSRRFEERGQSPSARER